MLNKSISDLFLTHVNNLKTYQEATKVDFKLYKNNQDILEEKKKLDTVDERGGGGKPMFICSSSKLEVCTVRNFKSPPWLGPIQGDKNKCYFVNKPSAIALKLIYDNILSFTNFRIFSD